MHMAGHGVALACLCVPSVLAATTDGPAILGDLLTLKDGRSRRVTSTAKLPDGRPDPNSNADNVRVPAGQTYVVADIKGPGLITHIWLTFLGPEPQPWAKQGAANHQELLLRMFWDGNPEPDVEAPVGDFFAAGFGMRLPVTSLPVQVEGGASYNCFWPMPFAKSARIEIVNQSDKELALLYYNIDWLQKTALAPDTPYFHAQYRQEYPCQPGQDYLIFEGEGRGHYVGTVLSIRTRSPLWYGEGDEKISVDDDEYPTIWGTGTEDYFLGAWGLRRCALPYYGVTYTDGGDTFGGKTCAYRWHLADPIVFQTRIRVAIEHYGWISIDENPQRKSTSWNERQDDYASVAFWYQVGTPKRYAPTTTAVERKLPEIDRIVHGRELVDPARHGAGSAALQSGGLWTDCEQMLYQPPTAADAWVEIPFETARRAPCRLLLKLTTSYDFGTYDVFLDGVKLGGSLDLYSAETAVREFPLLDFYPEPGRHVVRLVCVGRNPQSKEHWVGVDSLRVRERRPRVEQYGWDKDNDWRQTPLLY